MNHSQTRDLLPEFALGALEFQQHEELLEHLLSCASCYRLAQEHAEVSELLAGGIAVAEPPAALKSRIQTAGTAANAPGTVIPREAGVREARACFGCVGCCCCCPRTDGGGAGLRGDLPGRLD